VTNTVSPAGNDNAGRANWSLRLFGGFELRWLPGAERVALPGKRERLLLAYLALSPDCRRSRSRLATLLGGDTSDQRASDNLRTWLWRLRKAFGDAGHRVVASDGEDIVLDAAVFDVDVLAFCHLATQSNPAELEAAGNLYAGEFLSGLGIDGEELECWRRTESMRLRDQAIDVLFRLMAELSAREETERAIETGLRILGLEPLHEVAARRVMQLYGKCGRRGAAVQLYHQLSDTLRMQVGVEPEAETNQVFADIACGRVTPCHSSAEHTRAIAIAVLPFINLSGDAVQDYFSEGITEELVTALARIPGLRVVARRSASQFKGEIRNMRLVGQALGASHLIEGAVRKSGGSLRITAGLINANDATHIWASSYDRDLTDLLAIQEDIARAIAGSLSVPLGLVQGDRIVSNWASDPVTYQAYLRGRALIRGRIIDTAIETLEGAVARAPAHAPTWALLSQAYRSALDYTPIARTASVKDARQFVLSSLGKAEMAARKAIVLDPRHAGGYAALGYIQATRGKWLEADALFHKALTLDPNDPEALYRYSQTLAFVGRVHEALRNLERLRTIEPFVPVYNSLTAQTLQLAGQYSASAQLLESVHPDRPLLYFRNLYLARAYAASGRFAEAADALLSIRSAPQVSPASVQAAARLIRKASAPRSPLRAPVLQADLNFVYAYVGAENRLFDEAERELEIGDLTITNIWLPTWAPLRKTDRFKKYVRKAGMVDYWRARGWPDLCRPTGADDFVCD
jgi:TolB-like protein